MTNVTRLSVNAVRMARAITAKTRQELPLNALETATGCLPAGLCLPDDVVAEAALAACEAQTRVARELLGRSAAPCRVPCAGCLAAARAVAEVVIGAGLTKPELTLPAAVERIGE